MCIGLGGVRRLRRVQGGDAVVPKQPYRLSVDTFPGERRQKGLVVPGPTGRSLGRSYVGLTSPSAFELYRTIGRTPRPADMKPGDGGEGRNVVNWPRGAKRIDIHDLLMSAQAKTLAGAGFLPSSPPRGRGRNRRPSHRQRGRSPPPAAGTSLDASGAALRTAARTFSTDGMNSNHFRATTRPSTRTVNSPRSPSTNSTSTPGSFRKAAARPAARSRIPPQTGHWRIVTFFIVHAPNRRSRQDERADAVPVPTSNVRLVQRRGSVPSAGRPSVCRDGRGVPKRLR